MSGWKLLDSYDGMSEWVMTDSEGRTHVKKTADVGKELDLNQTDRNNAQSGWKGDMHKVASIPLIVVEQWWKELGSDPFAKQNRKWLIARLNSNEWMKLRTKEGNL